MGYYIETGTNRNKAAYIVARLGGKKINRPASFSDIPEDKALIIVVDNGMFEAAGLAYDEKEFLEFTDYRDNRPKQFVLLDKQIAYKESGYNRG